MDMHICKNNNPRWFLTLLKQQLLTIFLHNILNICFRLFEMGFGEQLHGIVSRLPERRQTLLFSATLPKVLVEFAKAGLSDPLLIR
jgi:hypothetical protein